MLSAISRRSWVNHFGVFILLAGLSVGGGRYYRSLRDDPGTDDEDAVMTAENSRTYEQATERLTGKFGLLMNQSVQSLEAIGEPRPFAVTIMVVSTVVAGGCFLMASRLPGP